MTDISVHTPINRDAAELLVKYMAVPVEFRNPDPRDTLNEGEVQEGTEANWVFSVARTRLAAALDRERAYGDVLDKKSSPEAYPFAMQPKYPLTQSMQAEGWRQFHVVVQTRTDEQCAAAGVKRKKVRYPVHIWVDPSGYMALAKIKMAGKLPLPY